VHCVDQRDSIGNSAFRHELLDIAMDGQNCPTLGHIHPQLFGQGLHGERNIVGSR
jgi:hypothetical protein